MHLQIPDSPLAAARWSKAFGLLVVAGLAVVAGVTFTPLRVFAEPEPPPAIEPVTLGAAGTYSVLSAVYVVNVPDDNNASTTIVRGNLGISTLGRISGFPPGEVTGVMHYSDSHSSAAQRALATAIADAGNRPVTASLGDDVGGLTLTSGVYDASEGLLNSGVLVLDGGGDPNAVFILRAGSSLTFAAGSEVQLVNQAQAARVFWQVDGSVNVGANSTVAGTIMSQHSIDLGDGATVDGRVLSRSGGVSMINNFVDITRPSATARFTGMDPVRLADTRQSPGWYSRAATGKVLRVQIADTAGVPANVTAAALNVTATEPLARGFLTVYPCTSEAPDVSTVNFVVGRNVANSTIATLANDGYVCVYTSVAVHVIIDITGWFSPDGEASMTPAVPRRVADTRVGLGGSTRLPAGGILTVDTGEPDSSAVAINVTAAGAFAPGYLTVFPCGATPAISTVNFVAHESRPNNAIVATGEGGVVCVFASTAVDVIVDVTSVFRPDGELEYVPASPVRLLDTRRHSATAAGQQAAFGVPQPGMPTLAVSVNITAVAPFANGYSTAYQCGADRPNVSTVNQRVGQANANGAIVGVGDEMTACVFTVTATNFIVDLNGWWVVVD